MTNKYSKQDGRPLPQSADDENVLETASEPTTTGDRSTEEKVGGQGLGQMSDEDVAHRADDAGSREK
jgi:hypothetical protein